MMACLAQFFIYTTFNSKIERCKKKETFLPTPPPETEE